MFYQLSCWHAVALAVRVYSDVWNLAALHGHLTWKLEFLKARVLDPSDFYTTMYAAWLLYMDMLLAKLDFCKVGILDPSDF